MEGRLYVIGMGPGSVEMMTPQAARALELDTIYFLKGKEAMA